MVSEKRSSKPIPPHIVKNWHPTKNLPLLPENLSAGSSKRKIHWMCEKGHEWFGTVVNETKKVFPCKVCAQFVAKTDGTDLQTRFPQLALEWHPEKNGKLKPTMVSAGSHDKVWWLGSDCGHEWEMSLEHRTCHKQGCPFCSSKRILVGFNDLATVNPEVAAEWHPTRNGGLTPQQVFRSANKKVWWLGKKCGHEWDMSINSRDNGKQGCPYCSGARVLVGFNDFATMMSDFVKEWDMDRNSSLPTDFSHGSKQKIWWKCGKDHSWMAPICDRKKYGCPRCAKENSGVTKSLPKNGSDLATANPVIASEWHPAKNSPLTPNDVNSGAKIRVWWQCSKGHEWQAKISDRRFYKTKCPVCALSIYISRGHQEIADFLTSYGITVRNNDRRVLDGKEIDIYLPDLKFGIEYNGLYWHTENAGKDSKYHWDKWKTAQQKGIQLIQIWEDEWQKNPKLIKNMILHKLGLTAQKKVFARKTKVVTLSKKEAEDFLLANHIQGYASGAYYYGLISKESQNLESVIVLKKEKDDTLNIIRYATSANVVGGFTKLISHAQKQHQPKRFITFSDNCVSDGGLYRNNGFIVDKELAPDYMYVMGLERKHKFGYRLKRFKNDPDLLWQEGKTERELALLNSLPRIWDAGKIRWVKELPDYSTPDFSVNPS